VLGTGLRPGCRLVGASLPLDTNIILAAVALWIGGDASPPLVDSLDVTAISSERRSHEFPGSHQASRSVGLTILTTRINILLLMRVFMLREVLSGAACERQVGAL
jgi:hypothetical protein